MDKHQETFIEEARELLTSLEQSLLELEENPADMEVVGRVFRAMHTIKGSGAMFGFDDIAAFTHEVETTFDLVREGVIDVDRNLINLSLGARDMISDMLESFINGEEADKEAAKAIVAAFQKINPENKTEEEHSTEKIKEQKSPEITYRIRLTPNPSLFATGTNPLLLLDELREMGTASVIAHTFDLPELENLEAEACNTSWDIILTTDKGQNAILDVFIFVEDDCNISIEIIDEEGLFEEDEDYKRIGEILIDRGELKKNELETILGEQKRIGEILTENLLVNKDAIETAAAEQQHVRKVRENHRKQTAISSIRVDAEKLDSLVDRVGELVTVQAHLTQKAASDKDPDLILIAEEVERLSAELRDTTMSLRMLPIGTTFAKFKRLVRDLSKDLGKEIDLVTKGGETELDKTVIDQLGDPLVHIIRNSVDHGIELPEEREQSGKPRTGTVELNASHSGATVLIRISDDGKGLDPVFIRQKAIEKQLISPDIELTEQETYQLIFMPGFSTAASVTDVSGRGVGMDVVKSSIETLRGTVEISSKEGKGTTITLKLPLTLAIIEGLMVSINKENYILPLSCVEECVELTTDQIKEACKRNMMNVRGSVVPYLRLRKLFNAKTEIDQDVEQVVLTELAGERVGLGVDHVIGQHQTVIKTLGKWYRDVKGLSGATILGNGSVALILDVSQLTQAAESAAASVS